jgi:hypothetical protein
MTNCYYRTLATGIACALGLSMSTVGAETYGNAATQIVPTDLTWKENPKLPPGVQTTMVWGDPSKPGLFIFRAKWPPNLKVPPHSHPSDEYVTVISGSWKTATGETFDEAKLQTLPPGGFYMLPANVKQFSATGNEETVIEVTAMGPWGVHFDADHADHTAENTESK